MEIVISGKQAVLKKNTSFEFISENRLFTGSDSYTLTITFPLKGCAENIAIFGHIHRADVEKSKVVFDCDIRDGAFFKSGTITITEISEVEVKTQFLEGRSEQNFDETFDDIYLNEMDLGYASTAASSLNINTAFRAYPDNNAVPLPWVNNYSGNIQNPLKYDSTTKVYSWENWKAVLTFQPYLLYILKRICEQLEYSYDFSALENSDFRYLLICNTLPSTWEAWNYAIALPHWTFTEFFEELENFLFGEFDINHKAKKITFQFSNNLVVKAGTICLDDVTDSYTAEVSQEDESKYLASSNLKYADNDALLWSYYSCDWFIRQNKSKAIEYATMAGLVQAAKTLKESGVYITKRGNGTLTQLCRGYGSSSSEGNKLLYCKENDTYFVMYCYKSVFYEKINDSSYYKYYNRLLPVNQFGERYAGEDAEDVELKIVPAWIEGTDDTYGNVLFLDCGEMGSKDGWTITEDETGTSSSASFGGTRNYGTSTVDSDIDYNAGDLAQGYASYQISKGEKDKSEDYFSVIYIGFWDGVFNQQPYQPHPKVDRIEVWDDFSYRTSSFSLRLNEGKMNSLRSVLYKIDGKKKYHFSFMSDTIPSPCALFYIRGGKYVCEKITATFHETGRSQLLKGIFYRVLED